MATMMGAVITEVQSRIQRLERQQFPWWQFAKRGELRDALNNYQTHLEQLTLGEKVKADETAYDPKNPEHKNLVDLLASPATFDS